MSTREETTMMSTPATLPARDPAPATVTDLEQPGSVLKELRERRRVSQNRLATMAGVDHSYISRLESGARVPTREAVTQISRALGLSRDERARLWMAYGYLPDDPSSVIDAEPELARLYRALCATTATDRAKHATRMQIGLIAIQLEQWT